LVAPILSFTADEVWSICQVEAAKSACTSRNSPSGRIFSEDPAPLLEEWKQIFGLRDTAMVKLEEARRKSASQRIEANWRC